MHKPSIFFLSFMCILSACNQSPEKKIIETTKQELFKPVVANFSTQVPLLPEGMTFDTLFREERDSVLRADGKKSPAKGSQDYIEYVPISASSEHGLLFVNHELRKANDHFGDAGGMSWFEVKRQNGRWGVVGDFQNIDFSPLGGTYHNCGGVMSPHHTILTAEEFEPLSNKQIYMDGKGIRDTSDFNGLKRYQNLGWMVEVDVATKQPLRKLFHMGRFSHEDAYCAPDGRTVYLTDDFSPSVFFKFVANKAGDYSKGQLYAYRQSDDGLSGDWLTLPMTMDSLINIRWVAARLGATMFIRHEWIEEINGKLYIAETGADSIDWSKPIAMGGKPAHHLATQFSIGNNRFDDPYGRILEFDPEKNTMRVLLHGGTAAKDSSLNLASPDGLASVAIGNKKYLVIHEDLTALGRGRGGAEADAKKEYYNEIYFLDRSITNPTLDDLQRFMAAPRGCETTGGKFTPDGKTFFVSIQHPDKNNTPPFDKTVVIAVDFSKVAL